MSLYDCLSLSAIFLGGAALSVVVLFAIAAAVEWIVARWTGRR